MTTLPLPVPPTIAPAAGALRTAGVCEADPLLREALRRALAQARLDVAAVDSGHAALARFGDGAPDVLVLAADLPDGDGCAVCRELRGRGVVTPILLTVHDADGARHETALAAGGDDVLAKPFALAELLVRVGGLLRPVHAGPPAGAGRARLDPETQSITAANGRVDLTPTEFRLLALLSARRGELVDRAALVGAGWPAGAPVNDNTLDAFVARIRRKLRAAGAPDAVRTRRGLGYELR